MHFNGNRRWIKGLVLDVCCSDSFNNHAGLGVSGFEVMVKCKNCGRDCSGHHVMCDRSEGEWCPRCFQATACGQGKHGESCPTQVFADSPPTQQCSPRCPPHLCAELTKAGMCALASQRIILCPICKHMFHSARVVGDIATCPGCLNPFKVKP